MSRGVRKPLDERLSILDQEITELNDRKDSIVAKIKTLESKKQELLDEEKNQKLLKVAELLENSGLSPEEVIAKLSSNTESAD